MALTLSRSSNVLLARTSTKAVRPTVGLRLAARPVPLRAYKGEGLDTEDVNKKMQDTLANTTTFLQEKWEKTEDKPAAVAVTAGGLLVLITLSSIVDTIDKIPIISDLIELVGIGVSGWFIWRFLLFGPDREELVSNIKSFVKKVYGA